MSSDRSPRLVSWDAIAEEFSGAALLLGNGFSISVDARFRYESLQNELDRAARAGDEGAALAGEVMGRLGTTNFEAAMAALEQAQAVLESLGTPSDHDIFEEIARARKLLRAELIKRLAGTHPRHSEVKAELQRRSLHLLGWSSIFTTNFDLLLYWMCALGGMFDRAREKGTPAVIDLMWGEDLSFDVQRVTPREGQVPVYYLHGGLHLMRGGALVTRKRVQDGATLLDGLDDLPDGLSLLFVSESDGRRKIAEIHQSEYLFHALQCFERAARGRLVTLGHSLGDHDGHILRAISEGGGSVAISVVDEHVALDIAARLLAGGFHGNAVFFDAGTHPLCVACPTPADGD